jgi:hypothetical protein
MTVPSEPTITAADLDLVLGLIGKLVEAEVENAGAVCRLLGSGRPAAVEIRELLLAATKAEAEVFVGRCRLASRRLQAPVSSAEAEVGDVLHSIAVSIGMVNTMLTAIVMAVSGDDTLVSRLYAQFGEHFRRRQRVMKTLTLLVRRLVPEVGANWPIRPSRLGRNVGGADDDWAEALAALVDVLFPESEITPAEARRVAS